MTHPCRHYATCKPSHVEGYMVAHAYLSPSDFSHMDETLMITELDNILTSRDADKQITIRVEGDSSAAAKTHFINNVAERTASIIGQQYGVLMRWGYSANRQ